MSEPVPIKRRIARFFSAKARSYERYALVQSRIAKRLVSMLRPMAGNRPLCLDLGCGTGTLAGMAESDLIGIRKIYCVDIAFDSLIILNGKGLNTGAPVQADVETLPFRKSCFDLVLASSTLQWVPNFRRVVGNSALLLKPGGVLACAVLLEGTLGELCVLQKKYGVETHVHFPNEVDFLNACADANLDILKIDRTIEKDYFPSGMEMLGRLSLIGSTAAGGRRLGRTKIRSLCSDYEERCSSSKGVAAVYEVLFCLAQKGER